MNAEPKQSFGPHFGPAQVLVYFAVSKLGEKPIDGKTDLNPEGLTAAHGKHAAAFAERLAAGDLSCKVRHKRACGATAHVCNPKNTSGAPATMPSIGGRAIQVEAFWLWNAC